jgi:choline-glycine betaine transporter
MRSLHCRACIVCVALAAVLLIALGASASTLGYVAVLLACPLMMIVMMRIMMGSQPGARERDEAAVDHDQR